MSAKNSAIEAAKKALPNNVIVATVPTETRQEPSPIGNLKPTPEMPVKREAEYKMIKVETKPQMTFEEKMAAFDRLKKKSNNLATYEKTLSLLEDFRIEDNENSYALLTIRDAHRKEFTTGNAHAITEVVSFLLDILVGKINQTRKEIAEFELPKI
jgi:hypothetical protein